MFLTERKFVKMPGILELSGIIVVFYWDLDKLGQQKICQETVWMVGGNFVNSESSSVGGRDPHQVTEPAQYVVGCTFYDLWLYIV